MVPVVGWEPGDMGLIPSSLSPLCLFFWTLSVITTPSTSKLWSCLSFLDVPAMQIRASEVQISICGDKDLGREFLEKYGLTRRFLACFANQRSLVKDLKRLVWTKSLERFWLDLFLVWKPRYCLEIRITQKFWARVPWEANCVWFLLVGRDKNVLKGSGKNRSCTVPLAWPWKSCMSEESKDSTWTPQLGRAMLVCSCCGDGSYNLDAVSSACIDLFGVWGGMVENSSAIGNAVAVPVLRGVRMGRGHIGAGILCQLIRFWGPVRSLSCRYPLIFGSEGPPHRALGSTVAVFFLLSVISVGMEWPDFLSSRPSRVCPCWKAPAVRNKLASCCISPSFHFLTAQMQQTWSFPKQWPIVWFGWFSYLLNIMLFHLRGNRLDTSTRVGLALCCCFNRQIKAAIFPA